MKIELSEIAESRDWKSIITDIVTKEKMNPWDIDISLLTENYIRTIKKRKTLNLRIPATAMLVASILLRYKSEAFKLKEEENELIFYIPDEIYTEPVIPELEPIIRPTTRRISLEELLSAIEDAIKKETRKRTKKARVIEKLVPENLIEIVERREDFKQLLDNVYKKVLSTVDSNNLTALSNILEEKEKTAFIETFIPLLHLANEGKLYLWQEKVFDEVFIKVPNGEQ
ncbi:hypothetical protein DRN74_05055 [Candidatus Micrarchaeota archaeon]|nr:MAG: hypothetical protein DRN74_05055 [Candidatus Micrarchaeota archaeon]